MSRDPVSIASRFQIAGDVVRAEPYGSGHINDTYAVYYEQDDSPVRYIFQRINHEIFKDVPTLMENIARTTRIAVAAIPLPAPLAISIAVTPMA